jgi:hypothetical protein
MATELVDGGFDQDRSAAPRPHPGDVPARLPQRLDVASSEVDNVIITHMHYHDAGNAEMFSARGSAGDKTSSNLHGWHPGPRPAASAVHPEEVRIVQRLVDPWHVDLLDTPT